MKNYLSHDRVRRGTGPFSVWHHKLFCMHVYKDLRRSKSVCDVKSRIDPCPSLAWSCNRWWLDFVTFTACKKSRLRGDFINKGAMLFGQVQRVILAKKYLGVRCTLKWSWNFSSNFYNVLISQSDLGTPGEIPSPSLCTTNRTTAFCVNFKIYLADFEESFVPLRCVHCFIKTKDLGVSFVSIFWKGSCLVFLASFFSKTEHKSAKFKPGELFLG